MAENQPQSVTQLVKNYGKRLFRFIRGKVRTEEDAEDILQEVWFQLSSLGNVEDLESASGWLFQVARNKVTDLYRRKKTDSLDDLLTDPEDGGLNLSEILLIDDSDPDMALFKEAFWNELNSALDELPQNQREVFIQNEIDGKTLQEIATESGENLKTIISRKGYAVKHLKKRVAYLYQEIQS
ncbi:MAG TPA: sigma-70 family RNA polymerase sigma factor [Catalimonadaceae bacterium]|nr:sigma-70 family RNA polymerase sigma factor [Catalimonadaceae bacterium]HPI10428.1 sigma-70 family RNA polymerase sigma factor [Catalimonadaceae bacterium]